MPYIGSTPTTQNFISGTDYFNGTGAQTAFTLTRTVNSVNDIQVVVNNVVQQPNDAYTLSGTTLTFTSAPSSGTNNVYVRYLSTTLQSITPSYGSIIPSMLNPPNTIYWNTSGNVGIGTTSTLGNSLLNVAQGVVARNSGGTAPYFQLYNANAGTDLKTWRIGGGPQGQLVFDTVNDAYSVGTERMRIDSSGRVLVGSSTAPSGAGVKLNLYGGSGSTTTAGLQLTFSGSPFGGSAITSANSGGGMEFYTFTGNVGSESYSERMRIDSSGNLLLATTGLIGNSQLSVRALSGKAGVSVEQAQAGDYCFKSFAFNNGGAFYYHYFVAGSTFTGQITSNGTTTAYATTSDYRLKENVAPMTNALSVVQQLKPVTYNWKLNGSSGQGFLAHELQEVCPDAVTGEKDAVDAEGKPLYQSVDTSFLVATLTAAIQEQQAMIEELKARIETLEAK